MKQTPSGTDGWDSYAPFYDWENAQTVARRDIAFWQRLALACGDDGPVLELGCGTGRVALPVVKAGATLVGVDFSAPMLARARRRLMRARLTDRALLVRGDIRHLPFRSRNGFGLVMAPYGILQSLTSERDLQSTLESVARVLRPGGLFALDLVPDLPRWSEYRRRTSLKGRRDARTTITLVESVRQDRRRKLTIFDQRVRRAPRPQPDHPSVRTDVPDPVGAASGPPPRACRIRRSVDSRRLSGRAVGCARGRLGHHCQEEDVLVGSRFRVQGSGFKVQGSGFKEDRDRQEHVEAQP